MNANIDPIVLNHIDELNIGEMIKDHLRYKAVRRLTPWQFRSMHDTSIATDTPFDDLADCLVLDMHTDKEKARI